MPQDNNTIIAKPFVKWAGGKGQLLLEYSLQCVTDIGDYDIKKVQKKGKERYVPFVTLLENIKL